MLFLILASLIGQVDYYYFTTDNCPHCVKMKPIIEKLQDEGFDFKILDEKSAKSFGVTAFPTVIVQPSKGKRVKIVGYKSYKKLKRILVRIK